jgi:hypothetical protein
VQHSSLLGNFCGLFPRKEENQGCTLLRAFRFQTFLVGCTTYSGRPWRLWVGGTMCVTGYVVISIACCYRYVRMCVCVCVYVCMYMCMYVTSFITNGTITMYIQCRQFVSRLSKVPLYICGPGIESLWGRDFSHLSRPALGPTQPPLQLVPGFSRG